MSRKRHSSGVVKFAGMVALLVGAGVGCSSERAAAPGAAVGSEGAAPSGALRQARNARASAEALLPPGIAGRLDRQESLELLNGPVRRWLVARVARSEAATSAYVVVVENNGPEAAIALREAGELWQDFGDQLRAVIVASVPSEFDRDPQLKEGYLNAVLGATERPFVEAARALQRCAARAEQTSQAEVLAACKERLLRLPEAAVKTANAPQARDEVADGSSQEHRTPERALLPGSQPSPCVFAGSLQGEFKLSADSRGQSTLARSWRLDLAALHPPLREGEAAGVEAVWPLQGRYWLAASALPLVIRSRQELIPDHVWLDGGTPLHVFGASKGAATAERPRAWTKGSEPTFSRRVSCEEFALAGSIERSESARGTYVWFKGLVELSVAPSQRTIAKLQLAEPTAFDELARNGSWRRVRARAFDGELPFSFDAWTKNAPSEEAGLGMIGLFHEVRPNYVSTQAMQLFVAKGRSAASLTLAPEVWFRAGKAESGFVPIEVSELSGPDNGKLWLEEREFSRHARALTP